MKEILVKIRVLCGKSVTQPNTQALRSNFKTDPMQRQEKMRPNEGDRYREIEH